MNTESLKKEIVLKEGDYCNFEGFVLTGCFKVYYLNENGLEQTLYFAVEGWWITDIDSLINTVPSILNIEALEDSEVLMISRKDKENLYKTMPQIEKAFQNHEPEIFGSVAEKNSFINGQNSGQTIS